VPSGVALPWSRLHDAVQDLVHDITERPAAQRWWRSIVAGVLL